MKDLRKRLNTVGERLKDYHYAYGELSEQLVALAEALEKNAVPVGIPLSLLTGDIKGACKELNQERYEMQKTAAEALRSLETFLGEGEKG